MENLTFEYYTRRKNKLFFRVLFYKDNHRWFGEIVFLYDAINDKIYGEEFYIGDLANDLKYIPSKKDKETIINAILNSSDYKNVIQKLQ